MNGAKLQKIDINGKKSTQKNHAKKSFLVILHRIFHV